MQIRNIAILKENLRIAELAIEQATTPDDEQNAIRAAYVAYMAYYDELDKQRK